jgi:hypothetical protein
MNCEELNTIEGLQFMPVKSTKIPIVKGWQTFSGKHDLSNCEAVGLVCGKLSGGLEVIDLDLKYDLTGDLFERYKRLVYEIDENILKKLVVQKTKNGGYHLIYRCEEISGNLKLANRHTTQDEKKITFNDTYKAELKKSKSDDEAKAIAQKSAENDKVRVLFETRGEGGQIVCFPSKGYEIIYGDYYSIATISKEERDILHGIARQFNEVVQEFVTPKNRVEKTKGVSPFDDYNERGDVVGLLETYGWKIVANKGAKTVFLRPGQTTSQSSGNYDHDKKWFSVFTTSSEFEPETAYMPYAVFAVLECNKNFSEASKKLYELGFGERYDVNKKTETQSTRVVKSRVNVDDGDYSFLATPSDYNEHLERVINGTLQMGMTTGSPMLDQNFLFKEGELVMANGVDNTGKSVWFWWLLLLSAMYHGWTGIIFSSENTLGAFMRKMIQFYWGKQLHGKYAMTKTEYKIAKAFIEKHFILIKAQEDLFNYKDIINMVKKARKKYPLLKFGMIDPYNSLKIDLSGFSKLSTHEYHYEALSEIKSYGQQTNFGWFVTNHAVTSALRAKDGEKKYPLAPRKEDTEGGGKFPNKADCFITVHRITQHPTEWMITEIHVRKIKDTETGGKPTPMDSPIKFEMYKGGCGFVERSEDGGLQIDPIEQWHLGNRPNQSKLFDTDIVQQVTKMWMPYADDKDDSPF